MNYIVKSNFNVYYLILFLFINAVFFILAFYNYPKAYLVYSEVFDSKVTFNIENEDVDLILNKKLYINNKNYQYQVVSISDIYLLSKLYKTVVLEVDNYSIYNGSISELKFVSGKTNFATEMLDFLKKGVVGWKN